MDKYNNSSSVGQTRSERNKGLYETVRTSSLNNYDVNSNISVIAEDASRMSLSRVKKIIDDRDNNTRRRVSIEIPEYPHEEEKEQFIDTKEYDINAILEKAKQGKNIDYSKERLKKIRDTQYEILNSLDLNIKRAEEKESVAAPKADEQNLLELINTITELELKNKDETKKQTEISEALDLLSDLSEEVPIKEEVKILPKDEVKKEVAEEKKEVHSKENIEKTLSKLNVDMDSFDDFKDISKSDKSTIILKIIIFVVIIGLVVGGLLILNEILGLNLF